MLHLLEMADERPHIRQELRDKAVIWMDKNKPGDQELKRFRTKAEAVLGIKKDLSN